ncbi:GAF domain-containing protein [Streptomyces piniterrae]|uniref:protein-serine/threonine phosphatase n=1 Tax=Streptomyces piniterrae TaxID=2571125 RepID=A0A4U0MVA6_9ACTN|nr:GAF domain-containing protein [Streptomyces piniterrae]
MATGETAEREDLLAAGIVKAVQGTGAYSGSLFLRSRDRRSIVLAATCGVPPSLLGGWHLIPVSSPIPLAVAYNSGRTVHLADADEAARRFPQLAVALPYAFGSCSVPVGTAEETFGAMAIVWGAPPGTEGLSKAQRRHLRATANRIGAALAELRARTGDPIECDPETVPVESPAPSAPAVRIGLFDWDLPAGTLTVDNEFLAIFGFEAEDRTEDRTEDLAQVHAPVFDGRADTLASRLHPGDRAAFRAAARAAAADGRLTARRLRVQSGEGGAGGAESGPGGDGGQGGHGGFGGEEYRTVELWGRVPEAGDERARTHLVGAVVDARAGGDAVAAVERLQDGLISLAPDGRVTYTNNSLDQLLGVRGEELVGQYLWDVLPWLSDPAFEYRHRSVMISQTPASFLACRPPDQWLAFVLHPDAGGVTGRVVPVGQPPSTESTPGPAPAPAASAAMAPPTAAPARLGVMYHVLQLGSALTEAVTAREVCDVVADQLLPAFGGQQLAIYLVRERTMHLLLHTGHHESFLDWLEGMPLHAHLPGTEALTSGVPLFIESPEDLAQGYPGIPVAEVSSWAYLPLIASSRPVGTCVLGFDEPHRFTPKDRSVLTASAGLIAQALERARLYDSEFALARGLQQALLPHRLPVLPDIRTTARYLPGTRGMDIGGDWYDVISTGGGVSLVIGDVEGHSIAAAATMAQLRSAVRAFATVGHTPAEVLAGANHTLIDLDPGLLASCCYIRLEPGSHRAYAVRAGHPPPLLRRPDGTTNVVQLELGPLLGVDHASDYPQTQIALPPGSLLALYTDGLIEERTADIDVGIDRLRASLAHARADSLDELADRLLHDAGRSSYRADDIALLLMERG